MEYSDIGLFEEKKFQVTTNQSSTVQSELRSTNQHSEVLKKNAYHNGANIEKDERELKKGDCKCIYNVG